MVTSVFKMEKRLYYFISAVADLAVFDLSHAAYRC